jgi:hypothetical protein
MDSTIIIIIVLLLLLGGGGGWYGYRNNWYGGRPVAPNQAAGPGFNPMAIIWIIIIIALVIWLIRALRVI